MSYYINGDGLDSSYHLCALLRKCLSQAPTSWEEIILLCIGTDRMTGDCLGPYVGYSLSQMKLENTYIYGTLDNPVHAMNLNRTMGNIKRRHPHSLIIAIDASIGAKRHLGYITVGNGSIQPGAAMGKSLPPVGDIHITGIVSSTNRYEKSSLQNTRLATVIRMANTISHGILYLYQTQKLMPEWKNISYMKSLTCL